MTNLWFWKSWPNPLKKICYFFLGVTLLSLLYYLWAYFGGSRLLIQWETISKIETVPLLLESFDYSIIPLEIHVDFYAITQVFQGSDLQLTHWPAYLLLVFISLVVSLGLSLATDLKRFWFLTSQVVFMFMLVAFKTEQLLLFDRTDKIALILAFVLYIPPGYYFHAINRNVSLFRRLLCFSAVTLLFGAIIYFFSGVSRPFLYLVNYGIGVPMALTVIFILFTAHELIFGFLVVITRNNTPESTNSFLHFLTISVIYLLNVLLLYLKNTRRIDWDFYYLDAFWILIATAAIGLWGLRQRRELFANIISFHPHAALGYLGLAAISFATVGYFFHTANDPTIEAFEDVIVFGQLSIGFIFLIYILFNFRSVLIENLKVYKVVYKPQKMPFFTMRIGGLIGVLGLFLLANQYPLDQAITGYYNGIGDLHRLDGKRFLAEEYYKLAAIYARTNHRSNYAIASMAYEDQDYGKALSYYKNSLAKQPTAFAYANTANLYQRQGSFFQALFILKEGLERFPDQGQLHNNLAMLYAQTDILDSALYFLNRVPHSVEVSAAAQANTLALMMRSGPGQATDSLLATINPSNPQQASNLILYASKNRRKTNTAVPPGDSLLNPLTFSWWYNYSLHRCSTDSSNLYFLEKIADLPSNQYYQLPLKYAAALGRYCQGNLTKAFELMEWLVQTDNSKAGYYNHVLGLWSLKLHAPLLARDYFQKSLEAGYHESIGPQILALSSSGYAVEAGKLLSQNESLLDSQQVSLFAEPLRYLQDSLGPVDNPDLYTFWNLQFDKSLEDRQKAQLILDLEDPYLQQKGIRWVLDAMEGNEDLNSWSSLSQQTILDPYNQSYWDLMQAVRQKNYHKIPDTLSQDRALKAWTQLGQAQMASENGDQDALSKWHFLARDPFFVPGILGAVEYHNKRDESNQAYDILLKAITINPYETSLLKQYGLQSMRLGLDNYAAVAVDRLTPLLPGDEVEDYARELADLGRSLEETSTWNSE